MSKSKRGRGRPVKYNGNLKKHIASLCKKYGNLCVVQRILNADNGSDAASLRSDKTVVEPLNISLPTIKKIASEAGVELKRGRPTKDSIPAGVELQEVDEVELEVAEAA